ncbi:MAG: o-succinylbenzoate synthase [Actinomycetota bacterium]
MSALEPARSCDDGAVTPLDPLVPVTVDAVELVSVRLPLATPVRSAASHRSERTILLVHVLASETDGWAECVAEVEPTYAPEYVEGASLVLRHHLLPRAWTGAIGDACGLQELLAPVRGHQMAKAALELAVLDAQLKVAQRSLADWLGATATTVPAGAALGLHESIEDLLVEADAALTAGAARLRVKITPGRAAGHLLALRAHVGPDTLLQADANGSFSTQDAAHLHELERIDEAGLACLEQPLAPDDLVGHARLAVRLTTPICLDESVGSPADLETAVAVGACGVLCLKPGRVGGWITARAMHDRCVELGLPVWVGGMLESGLGRAANAAMAALPGMALPPDLDPRGRFAPDLADPLLPSPGGLVRVPTAAGIGAAPAPEMLADADVVLSVPP